MKKKLLAIMMVFVLIMTQTQIKAQTIDISNKVNNNQEVEEPNPPVEGSCNINNEKPEHDLIERMEDFLDEFPELREEHYPAGGDPKSYVKGLPLITHFGFKDSDGNPINSNEFIIDENVTYQVDVKFEMPKWLGKVLNDDENSSREFYLKQNDYIYIEFEIPDNVIFQGSGPFEMADGEGNKLGVAHTIGNSCSKFALRLTFSDIETGLKDLKGYANLSFQFKASDNLPAGETEIKFPFTEENESIIFINKSKVDLDNSVTKKGELYSYTSEDGTLVTDPTKILWTVEVNKWHKRLNQLTVTDILSVGEKPGAEIGSRIEQINIYKAQYDLNGKLLGEKDFLKTFVDSKVEDKAIIDSPLKLHELFGVDGVYDNDDAYIIEYITTFDYDEHRPKDENDYEKYTFNNNVSVKYDEDLTADDNAKVEIKYNPRITKSEGKFIKDDATGERYIEWKIVYNPDGQILGDVRLEDKIPFGTRYVDQFDGQQNLVISTDPDFSNVLNKERYEIFINRDNTVFFDIKNVTEPLYLKYKTLINYDLENNSNLKFENVISDGSFSDSGSIDIGQTKLKKEVSVNHDTREATWTITVNQEKRYMKDFTITDTFMTPGIIFDENTAVTVTGLDNYEPELTTFGAGSGHFGGFTLNFRLKDENSTLSPKGETSEPFTITFKTKYDVESIEKYNEKDFYNHVHLLYKVSDTDEYESNSSASFDVHIDEKNNGKKEGFYNYEDKTSTWDIFVNHINNDLISAKLTDNLPEGMELLTPEDPSKSLSFYKYKVNEQTGEIITKGPDKPTEIQGFDKFKITDYVNTNSNVSFSIEFEDANLKDNDYSLRIMVRVKTKFTSTENIVQKSYQNQASFKNNNILDDNLKAKIDIKYGDQGINDKKSILTQDSDYNQYINWNFIVNPSQSKISDVIVRDTFSKNHLLIDTDTMKLQVYSTKWENGDFVKDKLLVNGEDYTLYTSSDENYDLSFEELYGEDLYKTLKEKEDLDYTFAVKFEKDKTPYGIDKAYIFEYQSIVNFSNTDDFKVTNRVKVFANELGQSSVKDESSGVIDFLGGSAGAEGTLADLKFIKLDQFGEPVPDAEFRLTHRVFKNLVIDQKTNKEGRLEFHKIPKGHYLIQEINPPLGYATPPLVLVDGETTHGYLVNTDDNSEISGAGDKNPIYNFKNSVLVKKDFTGSPNKKDGYEFTLYKLGSKSNIFTNDIIEEKIASVETDTNGEAVFNSLEIAQKLIVGSEYRIRETKGNGEYIVNTEYIDFVFEEFKWPFGENHRPSIDDVKNLSQKFNFVRSHTNYQAKISLKKVDGLTQKPLENVLFGLYKIDETAKETLVKEVISDINGDVIFENVAPGDYHVREIKSADHIVNSNPIKVTIVSEHDFSGDVAANADVLDKNLGTIENYQGSLEIKKVDDLGTGLVDATFTIYKLDELTGKYEEYQVITTDSTGVANTTSLSPGKYYAQETKAPAGYILDGKQYHFDIEVSHDSGKQLVSITAVNSKGTLLVHKYDGKDNNIKLSGAIFRLVSKDTGLVMEATSDKVGIARFEGLIPGSYELFEIKAPNGYIINTTKIDDVVIVENNPTSDLGLYTIERYVPNYKGSLRVEKIGQLSNGSINLPNTDFKLTSVSTGEVFTGTTDKDGLLLFEDLAPGKYLLEEVRVRDGFVRHEEAIEVVISDSMEGVPGVEEVQVINTKGSLELQKTDVLGTLLEGVTFELVGPDHEEGVLFSTTANGLIINDLSVGKYVLTEVRALDGFIKNTEPIEFEIYESSNEPQIIKKSLVNEKGSVILTKYGTNGTKLDDIEFELYFGTKLVDTYSTIDGMITVDGLQPGDYTFKEVKSNHGYILNTKEIPFTIDSKVVGKVVPVELTHTNYLGDVSFNKVTVTGSAIEGVEFTLYDLENNIIAVTYSDENGLVTFNNLKVGDYIIKETASVDGYILNTEEVHFEIKDSFKGEFETIVLDDFVNYKGSIEFEKVDVDGKPLTGAKFNLMDSQNKVVASTVSDENGLVTFTEVSVGEYTIVETESANGYIINTEMIQVSVDATHQGAPVVIELDAFTNYLGSVKFIKVDKDGLAIEGAEFTLFNSKGKALASTNSTQEGLVEFNDIPVGKYTIKETKAADGYILNTDIKEFEIKAEYKGEYQTLDLDAFSNYKGSIEFTKVDQYGKAIAGVEFALVNVYGETVHTAISSESGLVIFNEVAVGDYTIVETKTAPGYILNTDVIEVTIADEADGKPVVVTLDEFINYLGSVQFNKVDKDNNPLKGAEFTLYNAKGKEVASVLSDENGFVLFENVPVGPYTIKETKAPVGYIRNTEIRTFEVLASGKGEPAVVILNDLVNYQGKAIVKKVDPKGNILSGAEFNLLDSNGKVIATIDASSGLYHLENLAPGSYKLVETKAPKGFTLSSKEYKFEIPEAHQGEFEYITITVVNKPLSLPATGISSMIPTAILTMMLGFLFLAVREVQRRRYI